MAQQMTGSREVRAEFDAKTITVYQAYSPEIAGPALAAGQFVAPFKRERMTWIKPSFLWMMYRCGWATKPGQERVLAIAITRAGFEEALGRASLSHADPAVHASHEEWLAEKDRSPVRVQWDPERDLRLEALPYRSLQVGLGREIVPEYVEDWTVSITDVTPLARRICTLVEDERLDDAHAALPVERTYALDEDLQRRLGA